MAHFMYFLQVAAKKLVTVWAKVLSALERFFWDLSENGMVNFIVLVWVTVRALKVETLKKLLSQQYRNPVFLKANILHMVAQNSPFSISKRTQ